jgi:hypothetical protein
MTDAAHPPTRATALNTLRTVHRQAEHLEAAADRVLTRCVSGQIASSDLAHDLHAIDAAAASIRSALSQMSE